MQGKAGELNGNYWLEIKGGNDQDDAESKINIKGR